MNWFKKIVPCGIVGKGVTSLSRELETEISVEQVEPVLTKHFGERFSATMVECNDSDLEEFLPPELNLNL